MLEYESSLSSEKINSVYCKLTRKPSVTTLSVKTKIMVTTTVSKAPEIIQFSSQPFNRSNRYMYSLYMYM